MASVLILEDHLIIANTIKMMAEESGHRVVSICTNAKQAVEATKDKEPEVLLLDVGIKDQAGGPEVLRRLRAEGYTGKAVFVSAYPEASVKKELADLPYDAYLTKPVDSESLRRVLSQAE